MENIKKIAKKAFDVYTAPVKIATRIVGGITGSGNRNVNPIYRQMSETSRLISQDPTYKINKAKKSK